MQCTSALLIASTDGNGN